MGIETRENYLSGAWQRKGLRITELNSGRGKQGRHFHVITSQHLIKQDEVYAWQHWRK